LAPASGTSSEPVAELIWVDMGRASCRNLRAPLAKVGLEAFLTSWGPVSAVNIPLCCGTEGLPGILRPQDTLPLHLGEDQRPLSFCSRPCVGHQTYTIHAGLTPITSPKGLLSNHAFPVSRRHAPATLARFLSCTDGLGLSVGKQCETILGWFLNFLGSLIRRHSADVQLKPASPKYKLE